ncbi:MAG: aminoacyl-tRNA deacylase [Anaerolineae bacterium]|nr:aminoacyl-tRNA deacylase [Anaerolineae bacterium]
MTDEIKKLNSMRFLEAQEVNYEVLTYDENIRDGVGAAEAMGLPPAQVYKTLVVQLKGGEHALVMIASDQSLDLKQFARSIGQKKATMTSKRGAEAATGLKTGGIGALALTHKRWGVYLDKAAEQYDAILVNAGQRGVNLKVGVADLVRVLNAMTLELSETAKSEESDEA